MVSGEWRNGSLNCDQVRAQLHEMLCALRAAVEPPQPPEDNILLRNPRKTASRRRHVRGWRSHDSWAVAERGLQERGSWIKRTHATTAIATLRCPPTQRAKRLPRGSPRQAAQKPASTEEIQLRVPLWPRTT